jgi:predicted glycosyltransferase
MTTDMPRTLGRGMRLLMYAHAVTGLGHLRRSLAIAGHLSEAIPGLSTLLVTGSPAANHFVLPPGVDYVKLPAVVKASAEQYRARDLDLSPEHIIGLRAAIITEVVTHFHPDVVLVDHAPLGLKGELLPALQYLHRAAPRARLVLGLRDVLDESHKVRRQWAEQGMYTAIEEFYDRVLVYGQRDIFDAVSAYALPPSLAAGTLTGSVGALLETHFCGYIQREDAMRSVADLRAELNLGDDPFVLVTAGGGSDGALLEDLFLDAFAGMDRRHATHAVIITGPLMPRQVRVRLEERARELPVRLLNFHPDVPGLIRASALVVAMGGYNTLCEIVSAGRPAVIVPRTHPNREQYIRAQAFAARGLVEMVPADEVTPARLATAVERALLQGSPPAAIHKQWDGNGLPRIAGQIIDLLSSHFRLRQRASA